jgi:hypothetical protein
MTDAFEYVARLASGDTVDRPSALWRRSGDAWEYLSLIDWDWHPKGDLPLPHPDALVSVTAEQAANLLSDRQRFVRYWARYSSADPAPTELPITVYRRRRSPEHHLDEAFGRDDRWTPTTTISEAEFSGTSDPAHLVAIDAATAERMIREIAGVSGATAL